MTLVSSERLYTGRIINLDRDTVRFPDGSTRPAGDDPASRCLGSGALPR